MLFILFRITLFFFSFLSNITYPQIDYDTSVQPIFNNNCISCHQFPVRAGALELNNYNNLMLGESNNGPVVVPSNPDSSLLYRVLLRDSIIVPNEPICCRMPKDSDPLTESEIAIIYQWIEQGSEENSLKNKNEIELINHSNFIYNYPNPFNQNTTFVFELSKRSNIILIIYDNLGEEIKRISKIDLFKGLNIIKWNGRNKNGYNIPTGVYFYVFESNYFRTSNKMIYIK